jgi:hypothetical protein
MYVLIGVDRGIGCKMIKGRMNVIPLDIEVGMGM